MSKQGIIEEPSTTQDEEQVGSTALFSLRPYYEDANVEIYHGDSVDVLPSLGRFDLCLTDPPYGVAYQSNRMAGKGAKPITNDGTRLSLALYRQILPKIKADHLLWFTRWDAWPDVWAILGQYFPLRGMLVWDKGTPGMGDLSHWGLSYELIASAGTAKISGGRDSSILKIQWRGIPWPRSSHRKTASPAGIPDREDSARNHS